MEAPTAADTAVVDTPVPQEDVERTFPPLELGPALFLVDRSGSTTDEAVATPRLMPVALLGDDGLEPFPGPDDIERFGERFIRDRMSPGRRFVLYAGGARVGTFYPDSVGSDPAFGTPDPEPPPGDAPPGTPPRLSSTTLCTPRPAVSGWIEIAPDAEVEERLLAVPEETAVSGEHGGYQPHSGTSELQTGALNVASALYVTREIVWPPSVQEARRDMRIIQPPGAPEELIVATFLYGDSLSVGPAPPNAYSLFFIAGPGTVRRYEASYVRYREAGVDGKSAPRFIQHFDWDGDEREDALLELFGEAGRSFAALSQTEGGWQEVFEEECDAAPPAVTSRADPPPAVTSAAAP